MATNHISPEDAMLSHADTPEKAMARTQMTEEIRKELLVLDPDEMTFESYGSTTINWQRNGQWHEREISIRSLGADRAQKIIEEHRVDSSEVPRIENDKGTLVFDMDSFQFLEYAQDLIEQQTLAQYEKLLYGLNDKLKWKGKVVWDPNDESVCDVDAAMESLSALKLSNHQLSKITNDIDSLTVYEADTKAEDKRDWEKKSAPSSASPENSTPNGKNRGARRRGQRRTP